MKKSTASVLLKSCWCTCGVSQLLKRWKCWCKCFLLFVLSFFFLGIKSICPAVGSALYFDLIRLNESKVVVSPALISFVSDRHRVKSRAALCQDPCSECVWECKCSRPPALPLLTVLKFQTRLKESLFLRLILLPSGTGGSSVYMVDAARWTRRANLGTCRKTQLSGVRRRRRGWEWRGGTLPWHRLLHAELTRKNLHSWNLATSCYNCLFLLLCTLQPTDWQEVPFSLRHACKPLCFHSDTPPSGEKFHQDRQGAKSGSANQGTAVTPPTPAVASLRWDQIQTMSSTVFFGRFKGL